MVIDFVRIICLEIMAYGMGVVIHEVGHLFASWLVKLSVSEFSVGCGPVIFQCSNTVSGALTIRLIPLCGFCQIVNEDFKLSNISKERGSIVLAGGFVFNMIFAVLMLMFRFVFMNKIEIPIFVDIFAAMNIFLALTNFLPMLKNDGWKIKNYWKEI